MELTPSTAAYRLTHILDTFAAAQGTERFPVDVRVLALETARIFGWADPITHVEGASIKSLEGALFSNEGRSAWMLLYNDQIRSQGRVRFTQAHELGHYILHRLQQDSFECTEADVVNLSIGQDIEVQADSFAANLLMPLNDFRAQVADRADFDVLSGCAARYGVSLTAAALRWVKHTEASAVLISHTDGFIRWACSSRKAAANGAFFRSRQVVNEIPAGSLASDQNTLQERFGRSVDVRTWFPKSAESFPINEMKVSSPDYDSTLSLLVLPRSGAVWAERTWEP